MNGFDAKAIEGDIVDDVVFTTFDGHSYLKIDLTLVVI